MDQQMMEYSALPSHQQDAPGISPAVSNSCIAFENVYGQGRINQLGGAYINGRPLPPKKRLQIVEMALKGVKPCIISRELKVSHGAVSKILMRYNETGSISPGQIGGNPRSRISIQAVRLHILQLCAEHSCIGASQIQQLLVQRGICSRQNVPSSSRINRLLKAQKNRGIGEGQSEKEAENGNKMIAAGKPLSHSIENILGPNESSTDDGKTAAILASESKMNNDIVPSISSTSSSTSFEAHSSTIFNLASASDEENHQQQKKNKKQQQMMQMDSRRARTSFSQEQLRLLEKTFRENAYPGQEQKEWLVKATQLDEDKIITWFSNRRARSRRKAFQHCPSFQKLFLPSFPNDQNGQTHKHAHSSSQIDLNAQITTQQLQQPNNPAIFPFPPILPQFPSISPFSMFFHPPFGNFNGFPNFLANLQNMKASGAAEELK